MNRTKEEYLALVDETVEYYKKNPRAIYEDSCLYLDEKTGNMCAVGRCLREPQSVATAQVAADGLIEHHSDDIFKPEYRGFNEVFWTSLQDLHDLSNNWVECELTDVGERRLQRLKLEIKDGRYDNTVD